MRIRDLDATTYSAASFKSTHEWFIDDVWWRAPIIYIYFLRNGMIHLRDSQGATWIAREQASGLLMCRAVFPVFSLSSAREICPLKIFNLKLFNALIARNEMYLCRTRKHDRGIGTSADSNIIVISSRRGNDRESVISTRQSRTTSSRYARRAKRQEQHLGAEPCRSFPLTRRLLRANYFSIRFGIGSYKASWLASDNAFVSMRYTSICARSSLHF